MPKYCKHPYTCFKTTTLFPGSPLSLRRDAGWGRSHVSQNLGDFLNVFGEGWQCRPCHHCKERNHITFDFVARRPSTERLTASYRMQQKIYRIYPCISRPFIASKEAPKIALDLYTSQRIRTKLQLNNLFKINIMLSFA